MSVPDKYTIYSLDHLVKETNDGLELAYTGVFKTAFAVRKALDIIKNTYEDERLFKIHKNLFFSRTNLANDPSTQSKIEKISLHIDILYQYKDKIPNNFTALYYISQVNDVEKWLKLHTEKNDDFFIDKNTTVNTLKRLTDKKNNSEITYQNNKIRINVNYSKSLVPDMSELKQEFEHNIIDFFFGEHKKG